MFEIHVGESIEPLARRLAERLGVPGPNPLATELVAVPTGGMNRWIRLYLARHLGTSPGRSDGIAANIDFVFPGSIRSRLLAASSDQGPTGISDDAWSLDRLAWVVLDLLQDPHNATSLGVMARLPTGATWYSRARSAADLLDRYGVHRPEMELAWASGRDVDGAGEPLAPAQLWQPALWRLVRQRIGQPSPAQRLEGLIRDPGSHATLITKSLPERVSVFGSSTVPGGAVFMELAGALGQVIDVDLYLVAPSITAPDGSHPLLQAWAKPARETDQLLRNSSAPVASVPSPLVEPRSLLAHLAADVRAGRLPTTGLTVDDSIQIHSCYGPGRQLEAARDAVLAALADDPTLEESDITVLIPSLASMAPLIPSIFGPPARGLRQEQDPPTPPIDYVITDRSLELEQPFAGAMLAAAELLSGRFTRTEVLDFIRLGPVRERLDIDLSDISLIEGWADHSKIRWGLNYAHRARWGIGPGFQANTWRQGVDQLLMGIAISDDSPTLAASGVAAAGVEGSSVIVLGQLAWLISKLESFQAETSTPRTAPGWAAWARSLADSLLATAPDDDWQAEQVSERLVELANNAASTEASTKLNFTEFCQLLASILGGTPGRNRFFAGGLTVTSMAPMKWLPSRVTVVVGLDESAFTVPSLSGDDLVGSDPMLGDIDGRNEKRQNILELLLTTTDRLVVVRTGFSENNNADVPAAVTVTELVDVLATMTGSSFSETRQARQLFDARHLDPSTPHTQTFDRVASRAALAKAGLAAPETEAEPLDQAELATLTLADLRAFLRSPSRTFFISRLGARFDSADDEADENLTTEVSGLAKWTLGDDALSTSLTGADWSTYQAASGSLPPGIAGTLAADEVQGIAQLVGEAATDKIGEYRAQEPLPVDSAVAGVRLLGVVSDVVASGADDAQSILRLSFSKVQAKAVLQLWLDLIMVTLANPQTAWTATMVCSPNSGKKLQVRDLAIAGSDPTEREAAARAAAEELVNLYRLATTSPIPLFANTSYDIACGKDSFLKWKGHNSLGEAADLYNSAVWAGDSMDQLLLRPTIEGDPGHPASSRFAAYATRLWDTVNASLTEDARA